MVLRYPFLVGCLNPCLQGTSVHVGSPQPPHGSVGTCHWCTKDMALVPGKCLDIHPFLVGCLKPLPPRNQCTSWFAPGPHGSVKTCHWHTKGYGTSAGEVFGHTPAHCWMPKPLPPRNQCIGQFAPPPSRKCRDMSWAHKGIWHQCAGNVWTKPVKILMILNPAGHMLASSGFALLIWVYSCIDSSQNDR
jgi:hypothetical protein